jgi:hypothetical protein
LAQAARAGVSYERTLTIGRQATFIGPVRMRRVLERNGPPDAVRSLTGYERAPWTIEPFLRALGASDLLSLDASDYEGADMVHDLNEPVPTDLHDRFTVVFDGGSLEHVFNVPAALASYMRMVQVGGHVIIATAGNNYFGHGFYQFSPEFFYRVFDGANGFAVERLLAIENDVAIRHVLGLALPFELNGGWYDVADPAAVGARGLLQGRRPVLLLVQARRTAAVPVFSTLPTQSDYVAMWRGRSGDGAGVRRAARLRSTAAERLTVERRMALRLDVLPRLLPFLNPFLLGRDGRSRSFADRRSFRPVARAADDRRQGFRASARSIFSAKRPSGA